MNNLTFLDKIEIILVDPSHLGNVGSAARAMRTMGLKRLGVVTNKDIKTPEAIALAKGGNDILSNAKIYSSLDEAISKKNFIAATSARQRSIELPLCQPREASEKIIENISIDQEVAVIFGRERTGLTNEELQKADIHINIDADDEYSSLNLAMSVQVISYELRQGLLRSKNLSFYSENAKPKPTHEQTENFYNFLNESLISCGFLKDGHNGKVMGYLRSIFAKADLTNHELQIIYGVFASLVKERNN